MNAGDSAPFQLWTRHRFNWNEKLESKTLMADLPLASTIFSKDWRDREKKVHVDLELMAAKSQRPTRMLIKWFLYYSQCWRKDAKEYTINAASPADAQPLLKLTTVHAGSSLQHITLLSYRKKLLYMWGCMHAHTQRPERERAPVHVGCMYTHTSQRERERVPVHVGCMHTHRPEREESKGLS